jgi:predicted PurR-regulated permease PerM
LFSSSDSYTGSHRRINTSVRRWWDFGVELYVVMVFGRLGYFGKTVLYDLIVPFLLTYILTYLITYLLTYLLTHSMNQSP